MNVIPAQAAGVEDIIVCTPPGPDGALSPYMCAALSACGITRVFRAGGAQAIAAMAYGTETIPRADIVAGPGNLFVMLAKKEVFGQAGIDLLAGPSEICVIADTTADPACAAADLLSQAEHDPLSSSILITDSRSFAEQVNDEISRRLQGLSRSKTAESALSRYGAVILTDSLAEAAETANRIAPEHLEIMTQEPSALVPLIRNAGTVFLGRSSPEALGDYIAGPSHTLPTGGTARFSSGLSAETFLKRTSVISISEKTFEELSVDAMVLARTEGLEAHRDSISVRTE
jgi:histidinol dehydrogenase